ncbi:MAG: ATP-dependent Clp protease adaptor ClpS [Phycisphaerales bacterium]|nr:MAG: ATP-dependent Clp protease adaptor ClpS [Phycisphaerales bacterium]
MTTREPEIEHASSGSENATATATRPAPPRLDRLPPYKVLLHNDDVNEVGHVVASIVELTPLRKEEAFHRTVEAHETGVSLILVTHKERAELYRDQFRTKRLSVSIEPGE